MTEEQVQSMVEAAINGIKVRSESSGKIKLEIRWESKNKQIAKDDQDGPTQRSSGEVEVRVEWDTK